MITSDDLIYILIEENKAISEIVKQKFSHLSFDRLNFHPERHSWSAAECFDHLIVTNSQYIPLIENELNSPDHSGRGDEEFKNTLAGRLLINSNSPENKRKMKTPRLFRPGKKIYTKEVIKVFLDQNKKILNLICRSKNKNLNKIKINSPVTRLMRFNLGECFQIINNHDNRHIDQAMRILNL